MLKLCIWSRESCDPGGGGYEVGVSREGDVVRRWISLLGNDGARERCGAWYCSRWRRRFTIQPSCRARAAITSRAVQECLGEVCFLPALLLTDTVSANGESNGWSAHLLPNRSKKSKGRPCRWASAGWQFLEILTKIKEKDNGGGEGDREERSGSERAGSGGIWWLVLAGWSWENKRIPPHKC